MSHQNDNAERHLETEELRNQQRLGNLGIRTRIYPDSRTETLKEVAPYLCIIPASEIETVMEQAGKRRYDIPVNDEAFEWCLKVWTTGTDVIVNPDDNVRDQIKGDPSYVYDSFHDRRHRKSERVTLRHHDGSIRVKTTIPDPNPEADDFIQQDDYTISEFRMLLQGLRDMRTERSERRVRNSKEGDKHMALIEEFRAMAHDSKTGAEFREFANNLMAKFMDAIEKAEELQAVEIDVSAEALEALKTKVTRVRKPGRPAKKVLATAAVASKKDTGNGKKGSKKLSDLAAKTDGTTTESGANGSEAPATEKPKTLKLGSPEAAAYLAAQAQKKDEPVSPPATEEEAPASDQPASSN